MIAINIHFENFLTIVINKMLHFKVLPSAAGRLGTRRALFCSPRARHGPLFSLAPLRCRLVFPASYGTHASFVCASFVVNAAIPATHRT